MIKMKTAWPVSLWHRMQFKLLAIIFIVVLSFALITFGLDFKHEMNHANDQVKHNFSLIADILENDIDRWMTNRENDVVSMAANPHVQQYINDILTGTYAGESQEKLTRYWTNLQGQYGIYDEIFFVNQTGHIYVSTNPERYNAIRSRDEIITKPLETGKVYFQDAYMSSYTNKPSVAFSVPVALLQENQGLNAEYVGVLVCRIEIDEVIQPLLESRVNLGETGEVILINNKGTAITELRNRPGSALNYNLKSDPAARLIRGEEGFLTASGYSGREMVCVYRYLPDVEWGLIVRQETSEIFGPAQKQAYRQLFENLFMLAFVLGLIMLILNRFLKPVSAMAVVAGDISRGNFSSRVVVLSNDELGMLGHTINTMAGELEQYFNTQNNRHDLLQLLVSTLNVGGLLNKGLTSVCEFYGFQVGAIFLADDQGKMLILKAAYCPGHELVHKEMIPVGEGLEGFAVTTQQVQVVEDLPGDTVYTVNYLGGSMLPAYIVAVPLVFGNQALGVMSLATLKEVRAVDMQEELKEIGALIGMAVHNALSYEKAQALSRDLQDINEHLAQQNEELNAQSEELMSQTEELQAQSEEMEDVTRELHSKNAELERANGLKSEYLASLSHELRAPLNSVISFSEVLLDRVVGELNQQQEKYQHEILNSGRHLLRLIDDLLDLSKIDAGQVELSIDILDPAIPLEEAVAMVGANISHKNIELNNLVPRNHYFVFADRDKLIQVFLNLLTNAVKFTPKGGQITIGAHKNGYLLELWISDNGIGIAKEYHATIFQEFKQGRNVTREYGGTGLGLAITKKLIELQGGQIYVESEEGQGATFTITLPAVSSAVAQSDLPGMNQDNLICQLAAITYLTKPLDKDVFLEYFKGVTSSLPNKSPSILIVDDDSAFRNYLVMLLEPCGYVLIMADSGTQGVELAIQQKPDIMILDIVMPGVNGFQVLDKLSEHPWPKGLFVFIITSQQFTSKDKQYIASRVKAINERL